MILPDLAADGRANKTVTIPTHRALSILDRFFVNNEDWWKSLEISA
jgi:hypothetical protein